MFKLKKNMLGMLLLFVSSIPAIHAQGIGAEQELQLDPGIRCGRLPNGFTYYIKHVDDKRKKIAMRLVVKVGHSYQDQDQLDFAHAIEHLAFKCAQHFPVNLLDNPELLVRLGMEDDNITAITGSFHTRYYFDVPSHREDALDTGLLWFHDVSDLALTPEKINKERGPLRQEVVYRNGSRLQEQFTLKSMQSKICSCQADWSDFFEHNQSFSSASLMEFYKDWYRPDRMAVVIVGDIADIDAMESKVKAKFSDIKAHKPSKAWSDCRLQYLEGAERFEVIERQQAKTGSGKESTEFHLYIRDKKTMDQKPYWEGLQREVVWEMLSKLMTQRLKEAGRAYNTYFTAFSNPPLPVDVPAYRVTIITGKGQEQELFKKGIRVLQQAQKFGFLKEEWEEVKQIQLRELQPADTTQSEYWIREIRGHYVNGEALPVNKAARLYQWLSALSLQDFNMLSREYLSLGINDIGIITFAGNSYTEPEVRGWIDQVLEEEVSPYIPSKAPKQLLSANELSILQKIGDQYQDPSIPVSKNTRILDTIGPPGILELRLDNGVKVVLDTTDGKNNRVYLHSFSPNGASCFPEEDYFSAINAPAIIQNAGVGELDKFKLGRFLAGTSFWQGVRPYIENTETGIKGDAAIEDLEKLFQLVYLYFTQPRKDREAFEDWESEERERYLNPTYSLIQEDFNVSKREFLGDRSVVPKGTKRFQGFPRTAMDRAYEIYHQLFGNARDFTFLIKGDFPVDSILPMLQKYLGNLPNLPDNGICPINEAKKKLPEGPLYREFSPQEMHASYDMESVLYALKFVAKAEDPKDWKERIKMDALGTLMDSKIKELRYTDEAALFFPRAWCRINRGLSSYDFEMLLDCTAEELEGLRKACKQMVSEVKRDSFKKERFEEVIQNRFLYKYRAKQKSTFQAFQQLYHYYAYQEPWVPFSEIARYIKSLTLEDIRQTARKYLKNEHMMEFVMRNENKHL